jgi:hypothetical protein
VQQFKPQTDREENIQAILNMQTFAFVPTPARFPPSGHKLSCKNATHMHRMRCPTTCKSAGGAGKLLRNSLKQPKPGNNLTLLAAGNYLRGLGIDNQADVTRILDVVTNPNSLFGTKRGKGPVNPYVSE